MRGSLPKAVFPPRVGLRARTTFDRAARKARRIRGFSVLFLIFATAALTGIGHAAIRTSLQPQETLLAKLEAQLTLVPAFQQSVDALTQLSNAVGLSTPAPKRPAIDESLRASVENASKTSETIGALKSPPTFTRPEIAGASNGPDEKAAADPRVAAVSEAAVLPPDSSQSVTNGRSADDAVSSIASPVHPPEAHESRPAEVQQSAAAEVKPAPTSETSVTAIVTDPAPAAPDQSAPIAASTQAQEATNATSASAPTPAASDKLSDTVSADASVAAVAVAAGANPQIGAQPTPASASNGEVAAAPVPPTVVAAVSPAEPIATSSSAAKVGDGKCRDELKAVMRRYKIRFTTASSSIAASEQGDLNEVAKAITRCTDANIEIAGHTDTTGADANNYDLSWQRSEAVMKVLIAAGVPAERVFSVGHGARRPVAFAPRAPAKPQPSLFDAAEPDVSEILSRHRRAVEASNAANRRVEFLVR